MNLMKRRHTLRWVLLTAIVLVGMASFGMSALRERAPAPPHRLVTEDLSNARVIVKYRADSGLRQAFSVRSGSPGLAAPQHAAAFAVRLGFPVANGRILGPHTQVLKGRGMSSAQLAARLAAMPDVEWAVVDERRTIRSVPDDPFFGPDLPVGITPTVGQWYLRAPDGVFASAINAQAAWDLTTGSPSVTVAVLDTGVRFDHPDLVGKLYSGYDFVDDTFAANDSTGRDADASDPGDASAAGECGYADAQSSSWHGTQTAGSVGAATNNGRGMAGVGRNVMVLPIRVLGRCGGYDSDIVAGMRWASGVSDNVGVGTVVTVNNPNPARVLSMSFGGAGKCTATGSPLYLDAMREMTAKGVTVVVAAGNEEGHAVSLPANCPGAIAVAAVRHLGTKVGFSNLGPEVALAAPGGNCVNTGGGPCLYPIMTTTNSGANSPVLADDAFTNSDNISVGTSFAVPQVAGTVALMLSVNPDLSPAAIRSALRSSARPFPRSGSTPAVLNCHAPSSDSPQDECYCTTSTCGAGMLDAAAAVALVVPKPTPVITVDNAALQSSNTVRLSAADSSAAGGRTVGSYQWTIVSGGQYAHFAGSVGGVTAALVFDTAQGTTVVELRVTDSAGASNTTRTTAYAPQGPAVPAAPSGGGGGGSVSGLWVGALLFACACLWRQSWVGCRRKQH